jgi:hypothetical protein
LKDRVDKARTVVELVVEVIAALINDRWLKACGKLPIRSPVGAISSEYSPRWLLYVSIFSKVSRASSRRPDGARASTYQNEQMVARSVDCHMGSVGATNPTNGM